MNTNNEQLEAAKGWYKIAKEQNNNVAIEILENMFPELAESEEEKVRKVLVEFFKSYKEQGTCGSEMFNGISTDSILAWLEKQGESIDKIVKRAMNEKQRVLLTETNGNAGIDWDTRSLADTKMLLEYGLDFIKKKLEEQGEQKSTWSEEDKKMFVNIKACLRNANKDYSREIDWLKSITPQPKNEWSEEDEKRIKKVMHILSLDGRISNKELENILNWLKSLKDRYTWKPSDEQMKAVKRASNGPRAIAGNDYLIMESLYNDLKKLREE